MLFSSLVFCFLSRVTIISKQHDPIRKFIKECLSVGQNRNHFSKLSIELVSFCSQITVLSHKAILPTCIYTYLHLQSLIFIYLYYLYIYPADSQESNGGTMHKVSNYPDLLPEMLSYCCLPC